jgi:hypothetical protein
MRKKASAKQSDPMMKMYGRPVAYNRDILIEICEGMINGLDINTICASPGMPPACVFRGWIEDHKEGRAIYRSACDLKDGRTLAKILDLPPRLIDSRDWAEGIRANLKRGWPADWNEREYIPSDWSKVYPKLGSGPPVWSTEDRQAYDALINDFTAMIEPRDLMELMWTKEATDAAWEAGRIAREKNALPEWKYQRLQVLDTAQSRAIKRRDHAVRQIERWRAGLGAKVRRLPDDFIAEQSLAEHYGVDQSLADAESNATVVEAEETAPRLATAEAADPAAHPRPHAQEAAETAAPHASLAGEVTQEAVEATCSVADTDELAKAAAPLVHVDEATETATPLAPAGQATEAVLPPAPVGDAAESAGPAPAVDELAKPAAPLIHVVYSRRPAAPLAELDEAAETARPLAPTGDDPMEAVPTLTPGSEAPLLAAQSEAAIPAAVEEPK